MELVTHAGGLPTAAPSAAPGGCGEAPPDPAYSVSVDSDPDPPRAEATTFHLTVRRDGAPVTGATVCLKADMPDMQHPGVNTVARESSAGTYAAQLRFSMTGAWAGSVVIAEPGRPPVSVLVSVEVT